MPKICLRAFQYLYFLFWMINQGLALWLNTDEINYFLDTDIKMNYFLILTQHCYREIRYMLR